MATGHSILDTLNATSKGGQPIGPSGKFRTKDLPISQLYRNEGNFYAIVEIEELAGMILTTGLLENLAVVYDPCPAGQYRIVSGERRWEALKLLVSQGHEEFAVATCNVRPRRSKEEETVDLIAANSQRVKSIEDQLQEYSTLKDTLERMRANGQQLEGYDLESGRLRDVIAAILHKSATKIAQIERITGHLIPELRALLDDGGLKFSAAYKMAGMDEQDQRDAFQRAQEEGREITHKEAKRAAEAQKAAVEGNPWASGRCEMVNGACGHYPVIKANFMHRGNLEGCAGCCAGCLDRDTCDFCCGIVAAQRPAPEPAPVTEASPKTVTSLCFSCVNWKTCMDRTDKTASCEQYRNKNSQAEREPELPVTTYTTDEPLHMPGLEDEERDTRPEYQRKYDEAIQQSVESQEDVMDMIAACIEAAGLPETQMAACADLFCRMREVFTERVVGVDALINAFGCVDECGIVRDVTDRREWYTPGQIMDVIEETAEKWKET